MLSASKARTFDLVSHQKGQNYFSPQKSNNANWLMFFKYDCFIQQVPKGPVM